MPRPRTEHKTLPQWLYWQERRGYFCRRVRGVGTQKVMLYHGIGKVTREKAIKAWAAWCITIGDEPSTGADGSVTELIEAFVREEIPRKLRATPPLLDEVTAKEYRRQAPILKEEFGAKPYAKTPADSMKPEVLRMADVGRHIRKFEGQPGAVSANRRLALLSAVFAYAIEEGYCTYNPCLGVRRNQEKPRVRPVTQEDRDRVAEKAAPIYRLMLRLTEATGMRFTDIRLLQRQHITDDAIDLKQSKRGYEQRWEKTPAVKAILDEAGKLPGRTSSMYVFPKANGTPYSESGMHGMRRAAMAAAGITNLQHKDLRKAAINEANQMGMNATEFAGHHDAKTTKKHYITGPTRVKPVR